MEIIKHSGSNIDKLVRSVDSRLNSIKSRGVSYSFNVLNDKCLVATITVSGKKGTVSQNLVVEMNDDIISELQYKWTFQTTNVTVNTDFLSDLQTFVKKLVSKSKTLVNKIS